MYKKTKGFIKDGIINKSKFGKYPGSNLRILWILKEVNAKAENAGSLFHVSDKGKILSSFH